VGGGANVYEFGRFQNAATKGVGHVASNSPATAREPIPNDALDWVVGCWRREENEAIRVVRKKTTDQRSEEDSAFSNRPNTRSFVPALTAEARHYHERGYWPEIYNDLTGELLAGPFDPDLPICTYII
jgi:hypothetical protein